MNHPKTMTPPPLSEEHFTEEVTSDWETYRKTSQNREMLFGPKRKELATRHPNILVPNLKECLGLKKG